MNPHLERDLALLVHMGLSMIYMFLALSDYRRHKGRQWGQKPASVIKLQSSTGNFGRQCFGWPQDVDTSEVATKTPQPSTVVAWYRDM